LIAKKDARVHFIPDLKVGVFVTLRTPDVISLCDMLPWILIHIRGQGCISFYSGYLLQAKANF
jgi:hypothetical protein